MRSINSSKNKLNSKKKLYFLANAILNLNANVAIKIIIKKLFGILKMPCQQFKFFLKATSNKTIRIKF